VKPTQTPTDIDVAKMAAIIDCEGNIRIWADQKKSSHQLHLTVGNKDFALLEWCVARFGGKIYNNFSKTPTRALVKRWVILGRPAADVLTVCLPHFITKRHQAEIALRFQATYPNARARITESDRQFRESLRDELLRLTRRGPRPANEQAPRMKPEIQSNLFAKDF